MAVNEKRARYLINSLPNDRDRLDLQGIFDALFMTIYEQQVELENIKSQRNDEAIYYHTRWRAAYSANLSLRNQLAALRGEDEAA